MGGIGLFGVLTDIPGFYAGLLAAVIASAGVLSLAFWGDGVQRRSPYIASFAIGILTVAVFFHLIPEAVEESLSAIGWVAGGFTFMVLVSIAVEQSVNRHSQGAAITFGYASAIALAVHSFLDGIIFSAAFREEAFTGWLTVAGLLFHEFPEGVIAFFILSQTNLSRWTSALLAILAAGITTLFGVFAGNALFTSGVEVSTSIAFGTAAGAILFVVLVHLAPHAAHSRNGWGYKMTQLGVIIATASIIINSLGGGHHH